jgi:hypothetical protein
MTTPIRSTSDVLRTAANIVFCAAQIAIPPLLQIPGFFGIAGMQDIGMRSPQSQSMLPPPNFSFANWGPIFAAMLACAVYQALPVKLSNARLRRIKWWTAAAMALNASWEFVTVAQGVDYMDEDYRSPDTSVKNLRVNINILEAAARGMTTLEELQNIQAPGN